MIELFKKNIRMLYTVIKKPIWAVTAAGTAAVIIVFSLLLPKVYAAAVQKLKDPQQEVYLIAADAEPTAVSGEQPAELSTAAMKTETEITPAEGYCCIALADTKYNLNVAADGAGTDYEGVPVTVWYNTDDISQRFRLEKNDDGTFIIYAVSISGGEGRIVGIDRETLKAGLYRKSSANAAAFTVKKADTGEDTWYLQDPVTGLYLGIEKSHIGIQGALYEKDAALAVWQIKGLGHVDASGRERAIFPAGLLSITQGPYDSYSHPNSNATDIQTYPGARLFAPFTGRIAAIDNENGNIVWFESKEKVRFADGTIDYMTVLLMHDDDISDLRIGQIFLQGVYFYDMGTAGNASGAHVHITAFRGRYSEEMSVNDYRDENSSCVFIWNAFFVSPETKVGCDGGYPFELTEKPDA